METNLGIISVVPPLVAILLAFITRNAIFSLALACLLGVLLTGSGPQGFTKLMINALANSSFTWVFLLEIFIGILIAFFLKTGAIKGFTIFVERQNLSRAGIQLSAWAMGIFVFFSDYFSPLFVGTTMRSIADKARISREKMAYIADSTSAPVSVIVPITGWAIYITGITIGMGPILDSTVAIGFFIKSIPYNFYAIIAFFLVGLISSGVISDFGSMFKAENRARDDGKVLGDDATPMIGRELLETSLFTNFQPNIILYFIIPVFLIIGIAAGSFFLSGSAQTMEAFLGAVVFLGVMIRIQGIPLSEIMDTAMLGIKSIMPAVMILALAYTINQLTTELGTANYILSISSSFLNPSMLPACAFLFAAVISFSTGTSWGTFAIMLPIAVPMAFNYSGDAITPLVCSTLAAVAGGGVFGDHCSPLSDTSILASTGAASDHMDHIKTQIPYAILSAGVSLVIYFVLGWLLFTS